MAASLTLLDKAIAVFDPARALRRAVARRSLGKLAGQRAYEGASTKDGWIPRRSGASANADHAADAPMLRARARSLVQNNPYARKALDSLVANVVGEGITLESRARRITDRKKLQEVWDAWQGECDADGRANFQGLVAQAYRAMEQDGEVLIRLRNRRPEDGLTVPLQLQLLEIDHLDSTKQASTSTAGGPIISGIEFDATGKPAAYWLRDHHPGDTSSAVGMRSVSSSRVSADAVIHLFAPERPGQARGITRFAPVIARLRDLAIYEDAELARKQNESLLSVIVSGEAEQFAIPAAGQTASDAQAQAAQFGHLGQLAPGAILSANGQHVTVAQPAATGGYGEYIRSQLYAVAAGLGVTYEMLTGDLSQVNFSSARTGMLEFRRSATQRQWHVLVPRLLTRVWREFVDRAVLAGHVRTPDYAVEATTPRWGYVNPQQDVRADADEIKAGLSSVSEKLRQRGYQPERVFTELGEDFQRMKDSGALDALAFFAGKQAATPQPDDDGPNPKDVKP
jgi:lambda family phage portal protein